MIKLSHISKSFGPKKAVNDITVNFESGHIIGLVGMNGAGKSTLMRLISGVLLPEKGTILIDGEPVNDSPKAKANLTFLSDTAYFFPNATAESTRDYYALVYPNFDPQLFNTLLERVKLDPKAKVNSFSKGQKKQLSILLGISCKTKYLLCDETFDGLDPMMRQAVKKLFASELLNRDFTPIIASHNLRELEDICDTVGLLYNGSLLFSDDIDDLKVNACKIQCVLPNEESEKHLLNVLHVLNLERSGSLLMITARGTRESILQCVERFSPLFVEILPLSLEEIIISETEAAGYEIKDLIL